MIFFNNQLMKSHSQLRLYLVTNPIPFSRYEDHEAALQIQVYELIEKAIEEKEDPIALIEGYLGLTYTGSENIDEIASFIIHTDHMHRAMHILKENWDHLDDTLPGNSLLYGGAVSREDAVRVYSELTLRTYLETLASVYKHGE